MESGVVKMACQVSESSDATPIIFNTEPRRRANLSKTYTKLVPSLNLKKYVQPGRHNLAQTDTQRQPVTCTLCDAAKSALDIKKNVINAEITMVFPFLYISGAQPSNNYYRMLGIGITHVLNLCGDVIGNTSFDE